MIIGYLDPWGIPPTIFEKVNLFLGEGTQPPS